MQTVGPLLRNLFTDPARRRPQKPPSGHRGAQGPRGDPDAESLCRSSPIPTSTPSGHDRDAQPGHSAPRLSPRPDRQEPPICGDKASSAAIAAIRDQAVPVLDQLASRHELPSTILPDLRKIYIANVPISPWHVLGYPSRIPPCRFWRTEGKIDFTATFPGLEDRRVSWKVAKVIDSQGQIDLHQVCARPATTSPLTPPPI